MRSFLKERIFRFRDMHPFAWLLILYTGSALIGVFSLWFYYDRKDRRGFEASRRQKVFHCVRCGNLYAVSKRDVSSGVPCPECQYKNYELSY